jgi:6-phosphogluconolactonase
LNNKLTAYVGTYTKGDSKGIYKFTLDLETGKIEDVTLAAAVGNPTYLSVGKGNKHIYSVATTDNAAGVAAYSINSHNGELELINSKLFEGSSCCYVSLDKNNKFLFSANYHQGEVSVFPLDSDGSLKDPSSLVKHEGSGPNKERQEKPHAHYISMNPDEKHVCAVDLGIDKVVGYSFDNGNLVKSEKLTLSLKPGSGPRHMVFHPNCKFAYVLTELSSEVVALEYVASENRFEILQYISALPESFSGENAGGAIHISSDGRFLYASNRGHDSIAVFSINETTGKLQLVEHTSTQGSHPRDFSIDPTGKYLIVANMNTNNIIPFTIEKETGKLTQANEAVTIPSPVCIKFLNI